MHMGLNDVYHHLGPRQVFLFCLSFVLLINYFQLYLRLILYPQDSTTAQSQHQTTHAYEPLFMYQLVHDFLVIKNTYMSDHATLLQDEKIDFFLYFADFSMLRRSCDIWVVYS
jgi:hypothetical protein